MINNKDYHDWSYSSNEEQEFSCSRKLILFNSLAKATSQNNNQTLVLNYSDSKNTEEWNIDDVYTFSMSMSEGDAEFEFRLLGYQ